MIILLPTRRYRLVLSIGVWLLCAVFVFFAGAMILETLTVVAVIKLLLLVTVLTWVYRHITRIGEIRLTSTELHVLQPGHVVRIPFAYVGHVQQRAQTLVQTSAGLQTRVHRVILDVTLTSGKVKPVVISILSHEDAQWIEKLLQLAQTQDQKAVAAYLTTRADGQGSKGYVWVGISFLIVGSSIGLMFYL